MKKTFGNLIDSQTGLPIEAINIDRKTMQQMEKIGQRASAFGKRCREILDREQDKTYAAIAGGTPDRMRVKRDGN